MTQIPIYRAKKIDSDEWVKGDLLTDVLYELKNGEQLYTYHIVEKGNSEREECPPSSSICTYGYEIDPKTLAIHFPWWVENMFASFSKDGIGASIMQEEGDKWFWKIDAGGEVTYTALTEFAYLYDEISLEEGRVIEIHKG